MTEAQRRVPPQVDTSRPSLARVYDLLLGGKDNFEVDRALYRQLVELTPEIPEVARENRKWLTRAVRWLAADAGVDQFLDLGSGLPTAENTHQVAQRVNREAKVVYDPVVIAHGRALLEDNDNTHFSAGDLTRPAEILADPVVTGHLDFDRPLALLQCLTLHHVPDLDDARRIMAAYIDRLPSGSYVAMTHAQQPDPSGETYDGLMAAVTKFREATAGFAPRTRDEIRSLLTGLELVEPGVVMAGEWWPEGPRLTPPSPMAQFLIGAVARKP